MSLAGGRVMAEPLPNLTFKAMKAAEIAAEEIAQLYGLDGDECALDVLVSAGINCMVDWAVRMRAEARERMP